MNTAPIIDATPAAAPVIPVPAIDTTVIDTNTSALMQRATALTIETPEQFEAACFMAQGVAALKKEIEATFKPLKVATKAAHSAVCAEETRHLDAITPADNLIRQKLGAYAQKVKAAQEAAQEQARKEAQAKAMKEAEDRRLAEAQQAAAENRPELADRILETPIVPVLAPMAPMVPQIKTKGTGVSMQEVWKARIVNEALVPDEYWQVNTDAIAAIAKSTKGKLKIPGVEFYPESAVRVRT